MQLLVRRGTGVNQAPDAVVDPLCCTFSACLGRGKAFIYDSMTRAVMESETPFRGVHPCGSTVNIDGVNARLSGWRVSVQVSDDGAIDIAQAMTLERIDA